VAAAYPDPASSAKILASKKINTGISFRSLHIGMLLGNQKIVKCLFCLLNKSSAAKLL
jgi:hypothetical protein